MATLRHTAASTPTRECATEISCWIFGRQVLCVQTGRNDIDAGHKTVAVGSDGDLSPSGHGVPGSAGGLTGRRSRPMMHSNFREASPLPSPCTALIRDLIEPENHRGASR